MNRYQVNRFALHSVLYFELLMIAMRCNAAYNPNNPCDFPSDIYVDKAFSLEYGGQPVSAGGCLGQPVRVCIHTLEGPTIPGTIVLEYNGCERQNKTIPYIYHIAGWNWTVNTVPEQHGSIQGPSANPCAEIMFTETGNYEVSFTPVFGSLEIPSWPLGGISYEYLPPAPSATPVKVQVTVCSGVAGVSCKSTKPLTALECLDSSNYYYYMEAGPSPLPWDPITNPVGIRMSAVNKTGLAVIPAINIASLIKSGPITDCAGPVSYRQSPVAGAPMPPCVNYLIRIYAAVGGCEVEACSIAIVYEPCMALRFPLEDAIDAENSLKDLLDIKRTEDFEKKANKCAGGAAAGAYIKMPAECEVWEIYFPRWSKELGVPIATWDDAATAWRNKLLVDREKIKEAEQLTDSAASAYKACNSSYHKPYLGRPSKPKPPC